jgi:hypothetical protein
VTVVCGKCEREWFGPVDGPCPHCGFNPEESGKLRLAAGTINTVQSHTIKQSVTIQRMSSNPKTSPWYSTPKSKRHRKGIEVTISDEAREKLDRLAAQYGSRSAAVEALILGAKESK